MSAYVIPSSDLSTKHSPPLSLVDYKSLWKLQALFLGHYYLPKCCYCFPTSTMAAMSLQLRAAVRTAAPFKVHSSDHRDFHLDMLLMLLQSRVVPACTSSIRHYSSANEPDLKTTLKEVIPAKRELLKKVKSHASKTIGEVKVENTLGGMRYTLPDMPSVRLIPPL